MLNKKNCIPITDPFYEELKRSMEEERKAEEWFKSEVSNLENISQEEKDKIIQLFETFIKRTQVKLD